MTSANLKSESNFGKRNSPAAQIASRRQDVSSAGSMCLAAIAASVLIAWSVWNNRPTQPTTPVNQPVARSENPSAPGLGAVSQPVERSQYGVLDQPAENSESAK
jgi:hypothetical protein